MRSIIQLFLIVLAVAVSGCKSKPPVFAEVPPPSKPLAITKPIIKSADAMTGKVVSYNVVLRFAILNFPVTKMPAPDQVMFLYRDGLKIGEVKITKEQKDDLIVADLLNGEAKVGDEVRDK